MKARFMVEVDGDTQDDAVENFKGHMYETDLSGVLLDTAGVYYCPVHAGVANEDMDDCDFRGSDPADVDGDGEPSECDLRPCYYEVKS